MKRFSLGTLSAGASWFFTAFVVLWGGLLPNAITIVVFAVPCYAAYHKEPQKVWRPFTLLSIVAAAYLTFYFSYAFTREADGVQVAGFPIAYLPGDFVGAPDIRVIANHVLISGLCLLPLTVLSTVDTLRKARKAANQALQTTRTPQHEI
jgi:hypothetical protein